jgi:hypothetical protein
MKEASQNQAKQTSANPEQLIAALGAPASGTARYCLLYHPAVLEAGAPIHACAINCRNTNGKMPPCW